MLVVMPQGESSDSEFDEIMATQAKQKKDKLYQAFKKERRDRQGNARHELESFTIKFQPFYTKT